MHYHLWRTLIDSGVIIKEKFTKIGFTQDRLLIMLWMNIKYYVIGAICLVSWALFVFY